MAIEADGTSPIVLDLGTGLRRYGERWASSTSEPFRGHVLLTHMHWDHVQGFPFFTPLHREGASVEVFGPRQEDGGLGAAFGRLMGSPFFPIGPHDLAAEVRFTDLGDDDFAVGTAKVRARRVRHTDATLGFRVEVGGAVVVYLPDHAQACGDGPDDEVPDAVLELCDGADLLIHDAQHTVEEFAAKRHWGHCTPEYAVHVGREAGVATVALFHHDPAHRDEDLDAIELRTCDLASSTGGPQVVAAREGTEMVLAEGLDR